MAASPQEVPKLSDVSFGREAGKWCAALVQELSCSGSEWHHFSSHGNTPP